MILHWGVQKIWVETLFFWPYGVFWGQKSPQMGKNQGFWEKVAYFLGPQNFFSRVFCLNDFGYLHSISWSACVPNLSSLGCPGAISIGGAIMASPHGCQGILYAVLNRVKFLADLVFLTLLFGQQIGFFPRLGNLFFCHELWSSQLSHGYFNFSWSYLTCFKRSDL